jgi:hypothetical protein
MQQQQEKTHVVDCNDEKELDEMMNNLSLDTPGAARTEIEEAKEILIRDCARHIDMARAQRLLYQRLEEAAVCDARDGVEHSMRGTLSRVISARICNAHVIIVSSQVARV